MSQCRTLFPQLLHGSGLPGGTSALNALPLVSCSDAIREKMKKNYMSNPSYNYEIVNRASLACGPMVKWAIAQVRAWAMVTQGGPLAAEL